MNVTLPENIEDITLEQFQKYEALKEREDLNDGEHNKRAISIFTNIPYNKIEYITQNDLEEVLSQIIRALNTDVPFKPIFELNGVKYGFEPDLNNITAGQYADLQKYQGDTKELNKLMAILFRPVVKEDAFKNYTIQPYAGTERHSHELKQMPMNVVNGALGFFLTLQKDLLNHTLTYIRQAKQKKKRRGLMTGIFRRTDGVQPL